MAKITRPQVKALFETGDVPTQAEYADVWDSIPNMDTDGVIVGGNSFVVAFAGGGQANATLLTTLFSTISTVASVGDSIRLPAAVGGNMFGLINASPNSCNLFPAVGEQIMALGPNVPQAIASGEVWFFGSAGVGWAGGRLT